MDSPEASNIKTARFKRSGGYFVLILLMQVLGFVLNAPDYIPSWQIPIIILTCVLYFVAVLMLGFWVWRTFVNQRAKDPKLHMSLAKVAGGAAGILFWLVLTFLITALFFDREFEGNKFVKVYDYPEAQKAIYLYDDSWLVEASTFKVRESKWPWMDFKAKVMGMDPYRLSVTQLGDTIVFSDGLKLFSYELSSGHFMATQP